VLLIACANLASLLLARAGARQHEISIRLAIGAGRRRIVRQLLTETAVLTALGAAAGLLLASAGATALLRLIAPPQAQLFLDLAPDTRVLLFTGAIACATAVAFGLAPAWAATRVTPGSMFGVVRATATGSGRLRIGRWLVAGEVGLAVCLLIAALLFARTLQKLSDVPPGFPTDNLVLAVLSPPRTPRAGADATAFYDRLLPRLEALPGTRAASFARHVMLGGGADQIVLSRVPGFVPRSPRDLRLAEDIVGPRFFETAGIPLTRGRDFSVNDTAATPRVTIINESAARFYFGDRDPIGERLTAGGGPGYEIVGVASDTKYNSLRDPSPRMMYRHALQVGTADAMTLHVRTSSDPQTVAPAIRREIQAVDSRIAVAMVMTQAAVIEASLAPERTLAILSSVFGLVAVTLAAIGIYGLLAYGVAQRIPELGVRLALGARPADVSWLIMREMLMLVTMGVAIGVPAAIGLMRVARGLLFGLTATDPLTLVVAFALIATVALLAAYVPARRASRVNPVEALRYE
jgi:predicted permease